MLKFKLYRFIRVIFGARSFVKTNGNERMFLLVKSSTKDFPSADWVAKGWVEEWPVN